MDTSIFNSDVLLTILFVLLGVIVLAFFVDLFLQYMAPKWAEKEYFFISTKLGAIRAIEQGENVVDFNSNLEGEFVNAEGKYVPGKSQKDMSFWEERYGVDLLFPKRTKKITQIAKIGSISEGVLTTETITRSYIYKVSSRLGEYSKAETQDQAPIYLRWRVTERMLFPFKFYGCEEPFSLRDTSISTGVRAFVLSKTVDELFEKRVDPKSADLKLSAPQGEMKEKLEMELLAYLESRLIFSTKEKSSVNDITGMDLIRIEIGQIEITDEKVKANVEKRLNTEKEMAAKIQEAEGKKKIKIIDSEADRDAAKIEAEATEIKLKMQNKMLRSEVTIFANAFGKNGGALGYLAKNNQSIKALGGEIYSEVNLEGEKETKSATK